ncbi:carnitine O-palmitoyltransferase 2, mitochondrial-like isoform X1 [Varroa jacobsoni]|uniref:carnitine O-palmitoyltransferase 2, mitochondrial-like isoform X1 n=2 Tax=Varroa jacobsoni TaxID=62625 RepID=UPI000BF4D411|nr:carnitine O-palmitoyltransferase 2, mitochondrial-like isoform X1 [Varroa jacobsoni]
MKLNIHFTHNQMAKLLNIRQLCVSRQNFFPYSFSNTAIHHTIQHRNSSSWAEPSYQYLQRSKIPTMHFQKSLPRLPVPKLADTCSRYLRSLEPIVTTAELENTRTIVKDFEEGRGNALQTELVAENSKNKHTSYISQPWFDMYLSSRSPVPLNYNPFLIWRRDSNEKYNDQLVRASNLVISSLRFKKSLRNKELEPMVFHLNAAKSDSPFYRDVMSWTPGFVSWYASALLFKAYPLDMSQFKNLFNTTRIPRKDKDELLYEPTARHMAVLYKGNFYVFDVEDSTDFLCISSVLFDSGQIISPQAVYANLSTIFNRNDQPAATALGALTTMDRNAWAQARTHLMGLNNMNVLHQLDSAVMLLVLDEETFDMTGDRIQLAHHFLHGPANNRWFDKSFSLIVTKCGNACINFEHSWGDGVAILRFFNDVHKDSTENHYCHPGDGVKAGLATVRKLEFQIDSETEEVVKKATSDYDSIRKSLILSAVEHNGITDKFIKEQNLSPDAVFQLSFQLGFYKQNKFTPPTYESCSTLAFRHGRTETVRPATMETKRCVEAICSRKGSPEELRALIDEASKVHNQLTKNAALGQGFDRHLFALKDLAIRNGETLHDLYSDPAYVWNNTFILSTSTLHGNAFIAGGFAPVVRNGFGIGYGMPNKNFGVLVSAYKPHADAEGLAQYLKEGLDQIIDILLKCKPLCAKPKTI